VGNEYGRWCGVGGCGPSGGCGGGAPGKTAWRPTSSFWLGRKVHRGNSRGAQVIT